MSKQALSLKEAKNEQHMQAKRTFLPITILLAMVCAFFLLDAVLSLQNISFPDALLTHLGTWSLWPAHLLFPTLILIPTPINNNIPHAVTLTRSLKETGLLLGSFVILFLLYLLALRWLPQKITLRYILISTLFLGIICVLIPIVTSEDVFSYIAYARMEVIYHLNPLVTFPTEISTDPIYRHIYWITQPSIYGPVWIAITSLLQESLLILGLRDIAFMVLALRLFGLAMHLSSAFLIWSISGHLQTRYGSLSPTKRLLATLTFAWNPLLLFEACVNAHADTTAMFFILFAIWFLVHSRSEQAIISSYKPILLSTAMLAIATCLKLNVALLLPGLLFFLWTQSKRVRTILATTALYTCIIVLSYAPFWAGKLTLHTLRINPGTTRNINTLPDFLSELSNSIAAALGQPVVVQPTVSPAEHLLHTLSTIVFIIVFAIFCWQTLRTPDYINTLPSLIRWLAFAWLIYCALGSPWFWPWYLIIFFGLYALVEAINDTKARPFSFLRLPLAVHLLTLSMLILYCFYTWAPMHSYVHALPGFLCTDFRGLIWLVPLFAIHLPTSSQTIQAISWLRAHRLVRT
jgi:hypothetical protein